MRGAGWSPAWESFARTPLTAACRDPGGARVNVSSDGKRFVSVSGRTARVWETHSGRARTVAQQPHLRLAHPRLLQCRGAQYPFEKVGPREVNLRRQ
jgi:hypothetical protein